MRDVLIHDFMDVDLDIVWAVSISRIPELKRSISTILSSGQ